MDTCISIPLKFCTYEIWPESRSVRTVFPDGLSCGGMRDENNSDNIQEAVKGQGYSPGLRPVWNSLVDHELLHSLACEHLFNRPSYVLRSEAGDNIFVSARDKYDEEVLVLDLQYFINTGVIKCINRRIALEFDALKQRRNQIFMYMVNHA